MMPLPDPNIKCHRTGFRRSCRDIVRKGQCRLYVEILGTNPNSGEQINRWDCADALQPLLMIENSQQQRQTAAAVESFRNEMVNANNRNAQLLQAQLQRGEAPLVPERMMLNGNRD